jgi:hypothetical protein
VAVLPAATARENSPYSPSQPRCGQARDARTTRAGSLRSRTTECKALDPDVEPASSSLVASQRESETPSE